MPDRRSLPARPSLESLRKQAKKLARDRHLALRRAQLALAREYGFAGWQDLAAEVSNRLGHGFEWAAAQARRAIHDNDLERLKQLLAEYPALLSLEDEKGGLLGWAADAYGDAFDANREAAFTRVACAELLIDAGAVVMPPVFESVIWSRARGVLQLFRRKGVLPPTLKFLAALGDLDGVRAALVAKDDAGTDLAAVNDAFMCACRFQHETVASVLLDRAVALDPQLGARIDGGIGRAAFIQYLMAERALTFVEVTPDGPWQAFVMEQVMRAVQQGDLAAFSSTLQREPWLLGDGFVGLHVGIVERATLNDRGGILTALLDLNPALLRHQPPPRSTAIEIAFTYAKTHLVPLLTRVWPLPDDLLSAAAMGNLSGVKRWFDGSVASPGQRVLDTALAYAVINRHFDVADLLLEHGADINTTWNSHEPASILHHLVFLPDSYEAMQFLIDRGIDMTIKDYRWNSTAVGWARHGNNDETMARWLEERSGAK